jgi:capsular polysaccharide biosynthesis protein
MWNDTNSLVIRVLRRWWVLLLVVPLVVGLASWHTLTTTDRFRTTILLAVGPDTSLPPADITRAADVLGNETMMPTFADIVSSPRVTEQAKADIQLPLERYDRYDVRVTVEPDSSVLRVAVEGPGEQTTQRLAQALPRAAEPVVLEAYPVFRLHSLEAGGGSTAIVSLSWVRTLLLACAIGLGVGILAALWVDSLIEYRRNAAGRGLQPETGLARGQAAGANEAM